MSKKHKTSKSKQTSGAADTSTRKEILYSNSAMANFVMVFILILPFIYTKYNMDPVMAIRYSLTALFIILFVGYFYLIRRSLVDVQWPLLVKLIFFSGIAYGVWNFIGLSQAVNKQQVYYGLGRHFLNMTVLFIITQVSRFQDAKLLNIWKAACVIAITHTIVGLGQFTGSSFLDIPGNFPPYGFMANRNLYGSAQVALLPFCIFVLYKSNIFWKATAGLAITGILLSAILSQTRASWLQGITIILVALVLILVFAKELRKKWLIGTAISFAIIFLMSFVLISGDSEGEFSQSMKERTAELFSSDKSTAAAENVSERYKIWSKTLEVIKDKPITGVGMENWKVVVPKYGTQGLLWEKGFYIPDSTHNDYLLVAAESGIPGAIFYFGMWALIGLIGFKTLMRKETADRKILMILVLAGLAGFFVDSIFSFPLQRIEHTFYLFLMGGVVIGLYLSGLNSTSKFSRLNPILIGFFLLVGAFNLFLGLKRMNFEKYLGESKSFEEQKYYQESVNSGNKAKNKWVNIPPNGFPVEAYIGLSQKALKNFPEAIKSMKEAIKIAPYNKALYVNMGTVYTDMQRYDSAIYFYKLAASLAPKMDIIYYNLAVNYYQMNDYKSTLEMLNKADISNQPGMISLKKNVEALLAQEKNK